jgi:hypothetical protein
MLAATACRLRLAKNRSSDWAILCQNDCDSNLVAALRALPLGITPIGASSIHRARVNVRVSAYEFEVE